MTRAEIEQIRRDLRAPKQKHARLWAHAERLLAEVDRLRDHLAAVITEAEKGLDGE